jgi:ribulose-phosphate 3-epimerase
MKVQIAPSLLAADFTRLAEEVADVERGGADLLHLDLMDGHFVPNLTFGPLVVRSLRKHSRMPLDAHLMVTQPDTYISVLADLGVDQISVHVEACVHLHRTLSLIRSTGSRAGIAINPAASLSLLEDALDFADFVLVMSVNPGFGGQAFIPDAVGKIQRLRAMIGDRSVEIAVDGGIDESNIQALCTAGATTFIAGTSVFGATNRGLAIQKLRERALQGDFT